MGFPRLALVGMFVIGGILLFAAGLFMIGDRRLLFTDRFEMQADFGNVTGISVGTGVRLGGLEAGEVLSIGIPSDPGERFLVRMRVREDLRPLVRTDSVAAVLTDGLLGSVFIQIRSGSAGAPPVEGDGRIRGVDAVEIADLVAEGREAFRTIANEFVALRADMSAAQEDLAAPIEAANQLLNRVGDDVRTISSANARVLNEAQATLASTRALVAALSSGENTLGQLLGDDSLYEGLVGTAQQTEATMTSVRRSAEHVEQAVGQFSGPHSVTARLLADADDAATHARNAMADIAENTEALKRIWPFSGLFADRGFYNLDQLTRQEYRELLGDERYTPMRIWIATKHLFESDSAGRVTLADKAVPRLDEAMATLLVYPRDSPIVVEGYAADDTSIAYRQSQARADLVRAHLTRAYRRSASLTGAMPMGSSAEGSPSGSGSWDGVALTMLVHTDQLRRERPTPAGPP